MAVISILIPTYKPGDYIFNCFQSIEDQNISSDLYKVYICLNGPKEIYEEYILKDLLKRKFTYNFYYISESGVSAARNFLIEKSQEDFLVFVDDDDILSPNYLRQLLEISSEDTMGISYILNFKYNILNFSENYIGKSFDKIIDQTPSKFKTRKYFSSPWGKMISRTIIANYRFDTNLSKGEDSLFMALISKNIKLIRKTSKSACYYVNERNGSVTRRHMNISDEYSMLNYLMLKYISLLFNSNYDKKFTITRIIATFLKYFKVLKGL